MRLYTGPASSQLFPAAAAGPGEVLHAFEVCYTAKTEGFPAGTARAAAGADPETAVQGRYNLLPRRRRRWARLQARS